MKILIVSEKPSVAARIAAALGNNAPKRIVSKDGVSYYQLSRGKDEILVVAAVGHLFTIAQADNNRNYPVLDVKWEPSYKVGTASSYTKKYLDIIQQVMPKHDLYINACDFDIEGTVIGTNIIRFMGDMAKAKRMKFSTTTTHDLGAAYASLVPLDISNFYAGEVRHMLDWLWGINLSRALTRAVVGWNISKTNSLSIGRVQGPSLSILVKRELEIQKFKEAPFWRIIAMIAGIEFLNSKGDIFDKKVADKALAATKAAPRGAIESVESADKEMWPYPPFDLTSLQLEASRALRSDPSRTLAIAQSLYERSFISYPRTSSQKLPASLGLKGIIQELGKSKAYGHYAETLIKQNRFRPLEGRKEDEAHPAIFPTGVQPAGLTPEEERLYDLIARRFLTCFAEPALVERSKVVAKFDGESYGATGARIVRKGWLEFYPFTEVTEKELPAFKQGDKVKLDKLDERELKTQPPKRYTKAGLIAELEKRELGTKATRAGIIDTLIKRGYASGQSLEATKFGMSIYNALEKNCRMIVDEETTRRLEEDMEAISRSKKTEQEVIEEGKEMLLSALGQFDRHKENLAVELRGALKESVPILGKCPKDGGDLVIRKSRFGKTFAACNNYPKCMNTYSVPQGAKIEATGRMCEHCRTPIMKVIRKGKRPFEMDLDPNCITKKAWASNLKAGPVAVAKQVWQDVEKAAETNPIAKQAKKPVKSKAAKAKRAVKKTALKKAKRSENDRG